MPTFTPRAAEVSSKPLASHTRFSSRSDVSIWGPLCQCLREFLILTQAANLRSRLNCKMVEVGPLPGRKSLGHCFSLGPRTVNKCHCHLLPVPQAHVRPRLLILLITVHKSLCMPHLHLPHLSAICAVAGAGAGAETSSVGRCGIPSGMLSGAGRVQPLAFQGPCCLECMGSGVPLASKPDSSGSEI